MRFVVASIICVGLALGAPAFADDAKPAAKVEAKAVTKKAETKAPASQPVVSKKETAEVALPDGAPKDMKEALAAAQKGIEFAKAKNWWGMSAVAIFILMFVFKFAGLFKKVGKRWAYIIVPGLSAVAMLLSKFAGDLSWGAAVTVMTSGPFMAIVVDFVKRGVMGKEHVTPVNGGKKNG